MHSAWSSAWSRSASGPWGSEVPAPRAGCCLFAFGMAACAPALQPMQPGSDLAALDSDARAVVIDDGTPGDQPSVDMDTEPAPEPCPAMEACHEAAPTAALPCAETPSADGKACSQNSRTCKAGICAPPVWQAWRLEDWDTKAEKVAGAYGGNHVALAHGDGGPLLALGTGQVDGESWVAARLDWQGQMTAAHGGLFGEVTYSGADPQQIIRLHDGTWIVAGCGLKHMRLMRIAADGSVLATRTEPLSGYCQGLVALQAKDGAIVVVYGFVYVKPSLNGGPAMWMLELDPALAGPVTEKPVATGSLQEGVPQAVAWTPSGNLRVLVLGRYQSSLGPHAGKGGALHAVAISRMGDVIAAGDASDPVGIAYNPNLPAVQTQDGGMAVSLGPLLLRWDANGKLQPGLNPWPIPALYDATAKAHFSARAVVASGASSLVIAGNLLPKQEVLSWCWAAMYRVNQVGAVQWARHAAQKGECPANAVSVLPNGWMVLANYDFVALVDPFGHSDPADAAACGHLGADGCDDGNPCTADDCKAPGGCFHLSQPVATPCGVTGTDGCPTGACPG